MGKISNQAENTKTEENPAAEVTWVSALLPTGAPAPFLSDDDEKDPTSSCVRRPSYATSSGISTSDLPPLLADRTPEERPTSLPTWLSGQAQPSACSSLPGTASVGRLGDVVIWIFLVHLEK